MATLSQRASVKPAVVKSDRLFYTVAGAIFLVLIFLGFQHYIFGGTHVDGSPIDPSIAATVPVHGLSILAWYVLFFVQSLLISTQNRRLHMKLGWSVLVIAPMIVLTGPLVAIRFDRIDPSADWRRQMLLPQLTEIGLYAVFVAVGVLNRKRPRIHRPVMLLSCLLMMPAPTNRIPLLNSVFGGYPKSTSFDFAQLYIPALSPWLAFWTYLWGPTVSLGALLLLLRMAMTRRVERELAFGYAAFALFTVVESRLSATSVWLNWAGTILKL
jgi:hypothetical protein